MSGAGPRENGAAADDLQSYSDATWNAHGARWRTVGRAPEEVAYQPRPYVEDIQGPDGQTWRIWFERVPDGRLRLTIGVSAQLECWKSWDVRLMKWEVEEQLCGRRVVWMERAWLGAKPCDLTVGYLQGATVDYVEIPASAILPPPSDPGHPWRDEYRAELLGHIGLFAALEDGLPKIYRRARLSDQEREALDGWLHGLPQDMVAARARCRRRRLPELRESALEAIRHAFQLPSVAMRVMGDGSSKSNRAGGARLLPGPDLPSPAAVGF